METVLSLVAIGIIYSVVFLVKSLWAKNPGVEAKPLSEVFPEIKMYEQHAGADEIPVPQKEKVNVKPVRMSKPIEKPVEKKVDEVVKHKRFSISNKSEAKRAFIYSEIFNRKY